MIYQPYANFVLVVFVNKCTVDLIKQAGRTLIYFMAPKLKCPRYLLQ